MIDVSCVAIDTECIAINLYHIVIDITFPFQYISVPEFDDEIEGVIHKRRKVLTSLALSTEGAYGVQHEDPRI